MLQIFLVSIIYQISIIYQKRPMDLKSKDLIIAFLGPLERYLWGSGKTECLIYCTWLFSCEGVIVGVFSGRWSFPEVEQENTLNGEEKAWEAKKRWALHGNRTRLWSQAAQGLWQGPKERIQAQDHPWSASQGRDRPVWLHPFPCLLFIPLKTGWEKKAHIAWYFRRLQFY